MNCVIFSWRIFHSIFATSHLKYISYIWDAGINKWAKFKLYMIALSVKTPSNFSTIWNRHQLTSNRMAPMRASLTSLSSSWWPWFKNKSRKSAASRMRTLELQSCRASARNSLKDWIRRLKNKKNSKSRIQTTLRSLKPSSSPKRKKSLDCKKTCLALRSKTRDSKHLIRL